MRAFALLAALAISLPAAAQDAAVPAHSCTKPVVPAPGTKLDKAASDKLNAASTAYQTCVQTYLSERRGVAKQHDAIAKAHGDAANALVTEFNAVGTALQAFATSQAAKAK